MAGIATTKTVEAKPAIMAYTDHKSATATASRQAEHPTLTRMAGHDRHDSAHAGIARMIGLAPANDVHLMLQCQRHLGNTHVQRVLREMDHGKAHRHLVESRAGKDEHQMSSEPEHKVNRSANAGHPEHKVAKAETHHESPVTVSRETPHSVQPSLKVSSPADAAEKEAVSVARKVMRMSAPEAKTGAAGSRDQAVHRSSDSKNEHPASVDKAEEHTAHRQAQAHGDNKVSRHPAGTEHDATGVSRSENHPVQRQAHDPAAISPKVNAEIQSELGSGSPLPRAVRRFMEPRFGADFSRVKIHTDEKSAKLSRQLNAHAFTVGQNIFFGRDKFQPDSTEGRELIAHELTHTIQQGAAVRRREEPPVSQHSPPMVQRGIVSKVLDYFADKAYNIPGFRMFTIVIGFNPINMEQADRSGANILRAIVEFLPGGHLIIEALENSGVFQKVGSWIEEQFATLASIGSEFKKSLDDFIDSLGLGDAFHLGRVWDEAKALFTRPVTRLIAFAKGLFTDIIKFIKDAILRPLAKLAENTRGYDLLKAVLGQDPITGEKVPQTAETLIGGFMKLIGEEEIWENIKKANAIPRAWAWFQGALKGLLGLVGSIPERFIAAFESLTITDIVVVPKAFLKIASVFVGIATDFINWAGGTIWNLLEIIFDVVSPGAFAYIKKTGAALKSILKNPIPFVSNLVKAAKLGFVNFGVNFLEHLKAGLIDWLTGSLPGIYIPKAFSLQEILKFALSVLGLTWANIRQKLVKVVGEPAVKAMETGFDIVMTLVREGPAAAWDKIKEQLGNLKDMVIGGITDFVVDMVVKKAVPKLISMFIPGAGFISAILSIYDTIMVFVNKLAKIAAAVKAFVDSIVAIAAGQIDAAAAKVESTLAGLLSLAINFLAGFIGLGKVADKVMAVIQKIRAPIDKALDWLINWIVTMAKKLWGKVKSGAAAAVDWWKQKKPFQTEAGTSHELFFAGDEKNPEPMIASAEPHPALWWLDHYAEQAGEEDATDDMKKGARLIPKLRTQLKKDPNDPSVVADLKALFDAFESSDKTKETILEDPRTDSVGGVTVGVGMTVDWLDARFAKKHPGSPPQSGVQDKLMDRLETDPHESSPDKYVRGHLLNENLGGKGIAENLFPITGNANSKHLHSTEAPIKKWVQKRNQWVRYEVNVAIGTVKLDSKRPWENYVNSTFHCRAVLKNADGKEKENFTSSIPSTFNARKEYTKA